MELELTRINHLGSSAPLRRELLVFSLEGVQIFFYNDVPRSLSFFQGAFVLSLHAGR